MTVLGRALTNEERVELEALVHSRKAEVRLVERARIVLGAASSNRLMELCRHLGEDKHSVQLWVARFRQEGLPGLRDRRRSGAPCQYTPEQKAEVIAAALTPPQQLGLPFASWTHDRLTAYLNEVKHLPMSRSRIATLLREEGLRWHHQEGWFGEKVDPAFAQKRGRSSGLTTLPR
jgi:transposase